MTALRPELPELPRYMKRLPVDRRGYPVPWFVAEIDGEPDFRVIRPKGVEDAMRRNLCWVCGQSLGRFRAFVIGPMCTINRVSAEPPSHLDCATFSAVACPFLTRPHMRRRENNLPEDHVEPAGVMLRRNPGAVAVWVTFGPRIRFRNGLFDIGEPDGVFWYAHGRRATREEVEESIASGLPILEEAAKQDGPLAERALAREVERARTLLPEAYERTEA